MRSPTTADGGRDKKSLGKRESAIKLARCQKVRKTVVCPLPGQPYTCVDFVAVTVRTGPGCRLSVPPFLKIPLIQLVQ